jgi:hypothetical protein
MNIEAEKGLGDKDNNAATGAYSCSPAALFYTQNT